MRILINIAATLGLMAVTAVVALVIASILLAGMAAVYFALSFIFPFLTINTVSWIIAGVIIFYMFYEPASYMVDMWKERKNV